MFCTSLARDDDVQFEYDVPVGENVYPIRLSTFYTRSRKNGGRFSFPLTNTSMAQETGNSSIPEEDDCCFTTD